MQGQAYQGFLGHSPLAASGSTVQQRSWQPDESRALEEIVSAAARPVDWEAVAASLKARCGGSRSAEQCRNRNWNARRPQHHLQSQTRSAWNSEQLAALSEQVEDTKLRKESFSLNSKDWSTIGMTLRRTAKDCRKTYEKQIQWDVMEQSDAEGSDDEFRTTGESDLEDEPEEHRDTSSESPRLSAAASSEVQVHGTSYKWRAEEDAALLAIVGARTSLHKADWAEAARHLHQTEPIYRGADPRSGDSCRSRWYRLTSSDAETDKGSWSSGSSSKAADRSFHSPPARPPRRRSSSSPLVPRLAMSGPTSAQGKPSSTVDNVELLRLQGVYPECWGKIARCMVPERHKDEVQDRLKYLNALRAAYGTTSTLGYPSPPQQSQKITKRSMSDPAPYHDLKRPRSSGSPNSAPTLRTDPGTLSQSIRKQLGTQFRRRDTKWILHVASKGGDDLGAESLRASERPPPSTSFTPAPPRRPGIARPPLQPGSAALAAFPTAKNSCDRSCGGPPPKKDTERTGSLEEAMQALKELADYRKPEGGHGRRSSAPRFGETRGSNSYESSTSVSCAQ